MKYRKIFSFLVPVLILLLIILGYLFLLDTESEIPSKIDSGINIETQVFMSRKVFIISPNEEKNDKLILYFHGGAYMAEMTDKHWEFVQKLSKDTHSTIIVPDYPLTPKYTYKNVLEFSSSMYNEIIHKVDTKNLLIMGDSAGGGLSIAVEENASLDNLSLPSKTILISPWLDTSMSNPKIDELQNKDKELKKWKLLMAGNLYSKGIKDNEKYFINPINGEISKLKDITIFTGTYDILNPDSHLFQEKAQKLGVNVQIKEYETAPHIWIINQNDDLAQKAYKELLNEIKK